MRWDLTSWRIPGREVDARAKGGTGIVVSFHDSGNKKSENFAKHPYNLKWVVSTVFVT